VCMRVCEFSLVFANEHVYVNAYASKGNEIFSTRERKL